MNLIIKPLFSTVAVVPVNITEALGVSAYLAEDSQSFKLLIMPWKNEWMNIWMNKWKGNSLSAAMWPDAGRTEGIEGTPAQIYKIVDKNGLTWEVEVWSL